MRSTRSLFVYAVFTAVTTLGLICMGGLVTSKGVGMSVPDWPTSFGYNMFALPVAQWFHGGVFDEHTHRLWASTVGLLVVGLTRWLGGSASRLPLAIVGGIEVVGGLALLSLGLDWRGAGHFLAGIGGVVLLAAAVWARNSAAEGVIPKLGWVAFTLVQVQGLLGGLRVVLDKAMVGNVTGGTVLGLAHGCLGQAFFVVLGTIALMVSPWWSRLTAASGGPNVRRIEPWFWLGSSLVVVQLLLGAAMRHQHAGLAIPDFPLAYGQIWPATDPAAVIRYNQLRAHDSSVTAFQIHLQLLHRLGALLTVTALLASAIRAVALLSWASPLSRLAVAWSGLALGQATLGVLTIWTDKAADVATAHVAGGAMLFLLGTVLILVSRKLKVPSRALAAKEPLPALSPSTAR